MPQQTSNKLPDRRKRPRLEAVPSLGGYMLWWVGLIGVNMYGAFWLVLSLYGPENQSNAFGLILLVLIMLSALGWAYRTVVTTPVELPDLLTLVLIFSLWLWLLAELMLPRQSAKIQDSGVLLRFLLIAALSLSVLMFGASIGLRYCRNFGVRSVLKRCFLVGITALAIPGALGAFSLFSVSAASLFSDEKLSLSQLLSYYLGCLLCLSVVMTNAYIFFRFISNLASSGK